MRGRGADPPGAIAWSPRCPRPWRPRPWRPWCPRFGCPRFRCPRFGCHGPRPRTRYMLAAGAPVTSSKKVDCKQLSSAESNSVFKPASIIL